MNYIKHLNSIFQVFYLDKRLNPTHVSLYMALFQCWNVNRFPKEFYIDRQEIMLQSKIGSKATYHRCLKQLHSWNYIHYLPSHNPYKGSKIRMLIFETSSKQVLNKHETSTEQALVPNTNITKQKENINKTKLPKNEFEVFVFFKSKNWPTIEASKFYNHYQAIGWKIGGKIKIEDWKASASNWMLKAKELETKKVVSHKKDNLNTSKQKDYGQPL
ncbi:hypothetical protein DFQ09_111118 [Winogradskyella pacifica]|uniref:Uncharacterized protein n=1 Tax=Winogradskyella pacifica TaxID=664642 RepID=A0A3D9LK90_9FLAO|nr:hypothetical protein [Winogradskyella pacifica]REE07788.1 hypothetical protein DFQ09_111118 [Winogradskyella pacifica]